MEDRTRIITGTTQMGGAPAGGLPPTVMGGSRTQMEMQGFDPNRTQVGMPATTLEVECLAGNRFAASGELGRDHGLIVLKSSGQQLGRRAPLNVCLCIDRSGSMEGEPMTYVKQACNYVVDMLEPNDILSIVVFEEQVDVLMPARRVLNKALVKDHINRLQVGNTTNLYDGMMAACLQIASVMPQAPGYVSRVLLLTDGEPTAGLKDFASIMQQVTEQKQRGVSITSLGFGSEYNEELMAGIARRSGGNYYYIQRPDLLPEVFRRELETLMTIVAKNVRVRLQLSKWVNFRQVYGVQPSVSSPRVVEITVPDVERGTSRTVLAEFEFEKHPQGVFRVAKVDVQYDDIVNNRPERVMSDLVFEFTPDKAQIAANINPIVRNELEIAQASQNLQRTMMGMRTQQLTAMGALSELQKTRTVLLQAGQTGQVQEVDAAMQALQRGGDVEKTIIGTIYTLDQGRRQ
jgi:Ca-activated chloride channel homolog